MDQIMADLPSADEFFSSAGASAPKYDYSPRSLAAIEAEEGLPKGLLQSQMMAGSAGKASAVSKKGAVGPFQVLPSTAEKPGFGLQPGDPRDPRFSARYLKKRIDLSEGSVPRGVGRYNAGLRGDLRNPETTGYTKKVMAGVALPSAEDFFGQPEKPAGDL